MRFILILVLTVTLSASCRNTISECVITDPNCSGLFALMASAQFSQGRGVYTANNAGLNLTAFRLDAINGVTSTNGNISTGGTARGIAVDSARSILYVSLISTLQMQSYSIDRFTGALTFIKNNTMPNANANFMNIDSTGRFLYAIGSTDLQIYSLDGAGTATALGSPVTSITSSAKKPVVDPLGRYTYFADQGSGFLKRADLNSNGTTGFITMKTCGSQAASITLSKSGSNIICFNPVTSTVSFFKLQSDASLLLSTTLSPGVTGFQAGALNPNESVLFVMDVTQNLIRPYAVDLTSATVTVSALGGNVSIAAGSKDIAVDASGKFVAVLLGTTINFYTIGSDGYTLTLSNIFTLPAATNDFTVYNPSVF